MKHPDPQRQKRNTNTHPQHQKWATLTYMEKETRKITKLFNNKDIYKIRKLFNSSVQIEPPRKDQNIIQCMRCQQYGHTKMYCNRPFLCVKCGGPHSTSSCSKRPDTPAKCAMWRTAPSQL
jgi:hypothetical protein